jgi:hypothetical protein
MLLLAFVPVLYFTACSKSPRNEPLFEEVKNSGIDFKNTITETADFNVFKYRNFYNGGGVAIGDLNNDGLADLFFTANQAGNKLYINNGGFQFEDVSERAGISDKNRWSTGVVFVDVNSDGWLDIYVCNAGNITDKSLRKNQLFINQGNLQFVDQAAEYGLDDAGYSTHASFFDYDLDGDLDCFLVNNSPIPVNTLNYENTRQIPDAQAPVAEYLKGGGDHLFKNEGGKFREVTYSAGIHGSIIGFGLGVSVSDLNADGYPDIYVANDFFERDYLYINQQDGTFRDALEEQIQHLSLSSMGADIQDLNNDGFPDIFTTDMLPNDDYRLKTNTAFEGYDVFDLKRRQGFYHQFTQNALQVNNGHGLFQETAFYSGVAASDWSWGALLFDADNDGLSDILVCNGIFRDVTDQDFIDFFANDVMQRMVLTGKKEEVGNIIKKMPTVPISNHFYRNQGNLKFLNSADEWGLGRPGFSNGAAYGDLDNDGDLDLVINNLNSPASVYRNKTNEKSNNGYLAFSLTYQAPNQRAIGSRIEVHIGNETMIRELFPARGFQSCVDHKIIFGTGQRTPDSATIVWPNGTVHTIKNPEINKLHPVVYNASQSRIKEPSPNATADASALFHAFEIGFDRHEEDDFVDFYFERNIPFMLSKLGPKAAVADVNGDGLEDVFVGGAAGKPRSLYIQTQGGFKKKSIKDFETYAFADVTEAFFFDADGDGDADLFTGGGGNHEAAGSQVYQNLLFLNDGKGNFTLKRGAFPLNLTNCGAAVAFDFDNDGDLDVFIGNRSEARQYGVIPKSYLMQNDGKGNFADATQRLAPDLSTPGMITAAAVDDLDGDGNLELVLTGEWMAPKIYSFQNGKAMLQATNFENKSGWWQSLKIADLDGDGRKDLLFGNMGENFYIKADSLRVAKLWVNDFDGNGLIDKVLSQQHNGKDYPVFTKREITDQMPSLKANNLRHAEFALKTVQQLLEPSVSKTKPGVVNYSSSAIAWNLGNSVFEWMPLPYQAQLSCINAWQVTDVNGDNKPDIFFGGNKTDLLPQFCSLDACSGGLLINKGNRRFEAAGPRESGISFRGVVRDIVLVGRGKDQTVLFIRNNDAPLAFRPGSAKKVQ